MLNMLYDKTECILCKSFAYYAKYAGKILHITLNIQGLLVILVNSKLVAKWFHSCLVKTAVRFSVEVMFFMFVENLSC